MSARSFWSAVRGLLAAGFLAVAPAAQAQTTTVLWDGFNPNDPIGSAANRLNDLIRRNCFRHEAPITIGISAFDANSGGLAADQLIHITGSIHAAFSRTPNVQVAPFADIAGVLAARDAGLTQSALNAEDLERELQRVQVVVRPSGSKVGQNFLLGLRAFGRHGTVCDVSTDVVAVPPHLTGERFETTDNLFQKAVRDLRDRSRGLNQVVMTGRAVTGEPLEPHLVNFFVFQLRQAVTSTEATATQIIGNPARFEVFQAGAAPVSDAPRWLADVAVQERPSGYRIMIDLSRPQEGSIAYSGLVQPDALPATRRAELAGQRGARAGASQLRLRGVPVRVADAVDARTPRQQYAFNLAAPSFVEIDVPPVNGRGVDMKPFVANAGGKPLQHVNPAGERINLRRYRLDPGAYTINVSNPGSQRLEFTLSARAAPVEEMLAPEPPGRLTRQFQDWYVGEVRRGQQRFCYAFTPATDVAPDGWREQAPVIWMGVSDEPNAPLSHYLDLADRYAPASVFSAVIRGPDGVKDMPVALIGRHVNPVQAGRTGAPVLDREAIRAYTRGGELQLTGVLPDGRSTRVTYSLSGYRSAASAMAIACNRLDLARDLVWR